MIIDTTYLLSLAKAEIEADLLTSIDDGEIEIPASEIRISMISLFELQAKAAKIKLPAKFAIDAIEAIKASLKVEPFYTPKIIKVADTLSREIGDYVDCLILATAIAFKEDLITEDSVLIKMREAVKQEYGINLLNYRDAKSLWGRATADA